MNNSVKKLTSNAYEEAFAEAIRKGTCYKVFCHVCKTANPISCSIAMDARLEEQYGSNWAQNYSAYRIE